MVEAIVVTALDTFGNVATGYDGTAHFTSTDGQAILPADATLTEGVGTFPVTLKTAGDQSITASDTINSGVGGSTSGLTVSPSSAVSFTVTTEITPGATVTITVIAYDAYGNVATGYDGTVHFSSSDAGATLPADSTLDQGVGTFTLTFSTAGISTVTVADTVDTGLSSTQSFDITQVTSQAGAVVSSAPQTFYGQDVTLTATFSATEVGNAPMTGTVSFYDGSTFLGTVPLVALNQTNLLDGFAIQPFTAPIVSGQASLPTQALTVGNHVIRAVYSGDANYSTATSETPVSVQVSPTVTSTSLTAATTAQGTTLTANVVVTSPGDPTVAGTVSFFDGTALLGTVTIVEGVASLNLGVLAPGQHSFSATYFGGSNSTSGGSSATLTFSGVTGTVYLDHNANGVQDAGEPGLAGRVVFADLNHTGVFATGDPTATTDANGNFSFPNLAPGTAGIFELTTQDVDNRDVVDQYSTLPDGSLAIGVVPISPVAPVTVVPDPFASSPTAEANAAYVQSLYHAVLGRVGGEAEVAGWVAGLASGMTRQEVALGFVNSPEHRQEQVFTYYQEFLGRVPDPSSIYWVSALLSGVSEEQVVEGILESPEYQSSHQDPTLLVHDLYLEVLGRQGEASSVTAWVSSLSSGRSREAVIESFVESPEASDQVVESFYAAYLRRQPDSSSPVWVSMLDSGDGSTTEVAVDFLASDEFDQDAKQGGK